MNERFIKIVFLLLGVGVLLPWNAYISAKQYFVSRLCNEDGSGAGGVDISRTIEMWFSIVYNGASVLSLGVVILVQHIVDSSSSNISNNFTPPTTTTSKTIKGIIKLVRSIPIPIVSIKEEVLSINQTNYTWFMVMAPLVIYLIVFTVTTLLVFFTSIPRQIFAILTLSGLFICGVCTAIASSGIVGTAGLFPGYVGINPYFNGQAFGGLLVACANFVASIFDGSHSLLQYCTTIGNSSQFPSDDDNESSTNQPIILNDGGDTITTCTPYEEVSLATAGYFTMCIIILAACMVGYNYIDQYKRLVHKNSLRIKDDTTQRLSTIDIDIDGDSDSYIDDSNNVNDNDDNNSNNNTYPSSCPVEDHLPVSKESLDSSKVKLNSTIRLTSYQNNTMRGGSEEFYRTDSMDTDISESTQQSVTVSVWLSVQGPALSLFFTYFCTLAIFPVWTSELISANQCTESSSRIRNDLFVPFSFVIFNGGDLVGRYMSSAIKFERVKNLSKKLVWASVIRIFFFFFLFLFCKAQKNRYKGYMIIDNDLYSWSIQFLFAITNGFLTNIAFCYAPSLVENRTHAQQVASAILNFAMTFGLTVGSFVSGPFLEFASGTW
ncbi:MAG: hypothetical protein ACI8RD_002611 [Bacillariaceae sp.]|jgi:hypothetical protein